MNYLQSQTKFKAQQIKKTQKSLNKVILLWGVTEILIKVLKAYISLIIFILERVSDIYVDIRDSTMDNVWLEVSSKVEEMIKFYKEIKGE